MGTWRKNQKGDLMNKTIALTKAVNAIIIKEKT